MTNRTTDAGGIQSVAARVYSELRGRITSGDIPPRGLVQEAAIARESGASRTPVREALRRLDAEGLIVRSSARSYVVSDLTATELVDLYDLRGMLEGVAASLAAQRRGRVELARLEDLVEAMGKSVMDGDYDQLGELNSSFHTVIAEASQNRFLVAMIRSVGDHFERYRTAALAAPGRSMAAHAEHVELLHAIRDQDSMRAEQMARTHLREALRLRVDRPT